MAVACRCFPKVSRFTKPFPKFLYLFKTLRLFNVCCLTFVAIQDTAFSDCADRNNLIMAEIFGPEHHSVMSILKAETRFSALFKNLLLQMAQKLARVPMPTDSEGVLVLEDTTILSPEQQVAYDMALREMLHIDLELVEWLWEETKKPKISCEYHLGLLCIEICESGKSLAIQYPARFCRIANAHAVLKVPLPSDLQDWMQSCPPFREHGQLLSYEYALEVAKRNNGRVPMAWSTDSEEGDAFKTLNPGPTPDKEKESNVGEETV